MTDAQAGGNAIMMGMNENTLILKHSRDADQQPVLQVVAGQSALLYAPIPVGGKVFIGRESSNDLHLNERTVSKKHAVVYSTHSGLLICDLGSTNGTLLNGEPVQHAELSAGDHLELGGIKVRLDMLSAAELERLQQLTAHIEAARIDPLTGLRNRSCMDALPARVEEAQLTATSLSCAFVDIDAFKEVNDRFGHAVGDAVLRRVAALLQGALREGDIAIRYGGDELLIILPGTTLPGAMSISERLRGVLAEEPWDALQPGLKVTCSIGVAELGAEETSEEWIARADQGLYRSKAGGRDQVHAG